MLLERETGRSLVTDFGIARTAENASLTASGIVVGTPTYMSPEQVTGGAVDHRADLYALGIVGYEMLVGRPPFTGASPTEVLMKRVAQPAEPVERARPVVAATGGPGVWGAVPAASVGSALPVTGVQWPWAAAYCGLAHPPAGRLPTEEEWEAAAHGSEGRRYPWGSVWDGGAANTASARRAGPVRAGRFPRGTTAEGIADLIGNVWEWTASHAAAYPGGAGARRCAAARTTM